MGDVRKSVSSTLVVVPSVSSVDAVARIKVPEGLKGGIIMAEEFYEDASKARRLHAHNIPEARPP